jgi:hypothetical protein
MIALIKELILAEVKIDRDIVHHICEHAIGKPNYDSVYNLTYNQVDPKTEDLVSLMEEHRLTGGKLIMEIMAGNGFETREVKKAFPDNQYACLDNAHYFPPIPGLKYQTADCTDIAFKHPKAQDLIFIGSANASMCMLLKLQELLRLGIFLQNNVKLNGLAVLSYFEETNGLTNFIIDYSVKEIKNYHDQTYNGLYAHWFSAVKFDIETQLHHYYDLVAVSADDELTGSSTYREICYNLEPFIARSWQSAVVMEVMDSAGFSYAGNKWNPDSRFMPFRKVKKVKRIDYL